MQLGDRGDETQAQTAPWSGARRVRAIEALKDDFQLAPARRPARRLRRRATRRRACALRRLRRGRPLAHAAEHCRSDSRSSASRAPCRLRSVTARRAAKRASFLRLPPRAEMLRRPRARSRRDRAAWNAARRAPASTCPMRRSALNVSSRLSISAIAALIGAPRTAAGSATWRRAPSSRRSMLASGLRRSWAMSALTCLLASSSFSMRPNRRLKVRASADRSSSVGVSGMRRLQSPAMIPWAASLIASMRPQKLRC